MLITRQSQDKLNITTGGTERFARTRNKPMPSCILENSKEYVQQTLKRLYFWRNSCRCFIFIQ